MGAFNEISANKKYTKKDWGRTEHFGYFIRLFTMVLVSNLTTFDFESGFFDESDWETPRKISLVSLGGDEMCHVIGVLEQFKITRIITEKGRDKKDEYRFNFDSRRFLF